MYPVVLKMEEYLIKDREGDASPQGNNFFDPKHSESRASQNKLAKMSKTYEKF